MKHLILLPALLAALSSSAQTWQWGRSGGSQFNGVNSQPHEQLLDLATDKAGNVYALGLVAGSGGASIDGHPLTTYGNKDIVLASFSCTGAYRWSKVIGGASDDREAVAIATDTVGHVYVTGRASASTIAANQIHFGADSVQPVSNLKFMFLVQYDTAGTFKWLRQPSPDTSGLVSNATHTKSYDLAVTGSGDVYWLAKLNAGAVSGGGGWVAFQDKVYLLHYNAQGGMVDHPMLDVDVSASSFFAVHMARSATGKVILSGTQDLYQYAGMTIGGQQVTNTMFLAAFGPAGQSLWRRENTRADISGRLWSRPQIDAQGAIYYSGDGAAGDVFNGFAFSNSQSGTPYTVPFLGKADSNGAPLWSRMAGGISVDGQNSIALKNNSEVVLSGTGNSVWWDATHYIQGAPNSGYYIYTTRFDGAGTLLGMDSLKGTFGGDNYATCNALDRAGNLYIGGEFNLTLVINSTQSITNGGGDSDFFLTKLGYSCTCSVPTAALGPVQTAGKSVTVAYTGTTAAIDSVVWAWGDSTRTKVTTNFAAALTHAYPAASKAYTQCATAYSTGCGASTACQTVTTGAAQGTGVGVAAAAGMALTLAPNPAADAAVLAYRLGPAADGTEAVEVYDGTGRLVARHTPAAPAGTWTLATAAWAPGLYIVCLKRGGLPVLQGKLSVVH